MVIIDWMYLMINSMKTGLEDNLVHSTSMASLVRQQESYPWLQAAAAGIVKP